MFDEYLFRWLAILFCLSQSAMFSGLNLSLFSLSRLRLEVEASQGNRKAFKILELRKNANQLLTTILWGNVGINVLLTLVSNSVLTGVGAFFFSTVVITVLGEIVPQAYFSRNAIKLGSLLSPVLRFYHLLLYPVARPCSLLLDWWLGPESIQFYRERDMRQMIKQHIAHEESDIDKLEGIGALNFLALDDISVGQEGEFVDPKSVISVKFYNNAPSWPEFNPDPFDPFLRRVQASGKKWVIITDAENNPRLLLDADGFLRETIFTGKRVNPLRYCHRPLLISNEKSYLGEAISKLTVYQEHIADDVVDQDIILIWGRVKKVITGSDILGRLFRGIVKVSKSG